MSDLEDRITTLEERVQTLEAKLEEGATTKSNSLKEFVNKIDPSNHDETFLAIGYYFENQDGEESFTIKEVEDGYKRAKRKPYSNFSVLTGRLSKNNLIIEMGEKEGQKSWALTNEGEQKIRDKLDD